MDKVLQNIILGVSLAAPIGPASITVIKNGIRNGFFSAIKTTFGVISADTTHLLIVYIGISNFVTIPIIKILIFTFGCFILIYLGYQTIKEANKKNDVDEIKEIDIQNKFLQGYVVNISNPIAIVWWFGVFGSILASSTQNGSKTTALSYSFTIIIGILIWFIGLCIISSASKKFFSQKIKKYIAIVSGCILIIYGIRFGYNILITFFS